MTINYALFENNLTSDPDDYSAHVELTASANLDTISRQMIDLGSTVTQADILAVLEDMIKACEELLHEGYRVNMGGLVQLYPRIRGKFAGADDKFDKKRHQVDVGATPGPRVRKEVRENAKVKKVESIKPAPAIVDYVDTVSGQTNGEIRRGGIGTLNGHRLKFDATQADEGIYLVPTDGTVDIKIDYVQRNEPAQLVFLVPTSLSTTTTYHIEVRARMINSQELRTGRLDTELTAA